MELEEIVTKLIGPIAPVGETNQDAIRLRNLKETCDLVDKLLFTIDALTMFADSKEHSLKEIGQFAKKFLQEIKEA